MNARLHRSDAPLLAWIAGAALLLATLLLIAAPHAAHAGVLCGCFDDHGFAGGPFSSPTNNCRDAPGCTSCTSDPLNGTFRCSLCSTDGGTLDCTGGGGGGGGGGGIGGSASIEIVFAHIKFALNQIIVWLFLLATTLLLIGILQYITAGGDEEKIKKARSLIMYGILGLAVMVTVWAFATIIIDFFFPPGTEISIPGGEVVRPL